MLLFLRVLFGAVFGGAISQALIHSGDASPQHAIIALAIAAIAVWAMVVFTPTDLF